MCNKEIEEKSMLASMPKTKVDKKLLTMIYLAMPPMPFTLAMTAPSTSEMIDDPNTGSLKRRQVQRVVNFPIQSPGRQEPSNLTTRYGEEDTWGQ